MNRKIIALSVFIFAFLQHNLFAQSTAERVYNIFQTSCAFSSCHSNGMQIAGLDLEGEGADKMIDVYNKIVGVTPGNDYAANKGYKYIKPGDVNSSFLFRKINNELDPTITLHDDELGDMPRNQDPLDDEDIELVRQWILHGAPAQGSVIDPQLIDDFYNNNGIQSVGNPPVPPEEGEGFQLHLGPFFLPPGVEREVYLKHQIDLPEGIEIKRIETEMGTQSHHFILYRYYYEDEDLGAIPFSPPSSDNIEEGFRIEGAHLSGNIVSAVQNAGSFDFPQGTAIFWRDTTVLDLNSHYINSTNSVLACDVYVNIFTQPSGTALHEMKTGFIPYFGGDFAIPNDGQDYTFTGKVPFGTFTSDEIYMWAVSSHTHQWGKDYDIYKMNSDFSRGEHLYDASCLDDGIPGCVTEIYDYQHPPNREFPDYYKIEPNEGLEHEAVYNNTGDRPLVSWGNFTSEDEMMLFIFYYLDDIEGLDSISTGLVENKEPFASTSYPNPFLNSLKVLISKQNEKELGEIIFYDVMGKAIQIFNASHQRTNVIELNTTELKKGIYFLTIYDKNRRIISSQTILKDQ